MQVNDPGSNHGANGNHLSSRQGTGDWLMIRLGICAFGAVLLSFSTSFAESFAETAQTAPGQSGRIADFRAAEVLAAADSAYLIGNDKNSVPCPAFCMPKRARTAAEATVGERDVLAYTTAFEVSRSKLHLDSYRATIARLEKMPWTPATMVTQGEFRPVLDPVMAEPVIKPTE